MMVGGGVGERFVTDSTWRVLVVATASAAS